MGLFSGLKGKGTEALDISTAVMVPITARAESFVETVSVMQHTAGA